MLSRAKGSVLAAAVATASIVSFGMAPADAANIVVVVPNTIVVVTVRSWCGGSRRHTYQLNGPHDPAAPNVYLRRTTHTRWCFF